MISRIHNKFGTAGLVVAIVALVAALSGAAFAAGGGLTSKEKKEVKTIAKKFAGKQGAQGPQGAPGKDGSNGTNGTNGNNGVDGKSVQVGAATAGECPSGGTTVQVAGEASTKKKICNGLTGFTETLPSEATETGTWSIGSDDGSSIVPLSFNIPLAEAPEFLRYVNDESLERVLVPGEGIKNITPVNCLGSAEEPTAPPGYVCVYAQEEEVAALPGYLPFGGFRKLYTSGATFVFSGEAGDYAVGTWAVTAK